MIWDTELDAIGFLTLRANFQHKDAFAYSDNNLGWVSEVDMLDASITWDTSVEGLSLSLYGKNLLDESVVGTDTQLPFGGPLSTGIGRPYSKPPQSGTFSTLKRGRILGLELIKSF